MAVTTACIAGEEIHRQWHAGRISGQRLAPKQTPFGPSSEIFLVQDDSAEYYILSRYGQGLAKTSPRLIKSRANIYALKELGVKCILAWGAGGAITHNIAVGDIVVVNDLIDLTSRRESTFFDNSPLGYLRQFPVFCPSLCSVAQEVLHDMRLIYHPSITAAITEGPRLETPAEVRHLASIGAEIVTHTFVPEIFLARELQICYAAICYVTNYAEMGKREQPFIGGLFSSVKPQQTNDHLAAVVNVMGNIASELAEQIDEDADSCQCATPMAQMIDQYDLPADWHKWLDA